MGINSEGPKSFLHKWCQANGNSINIFHWLTLLEVKKEYNTHIPYNIAIKSLMYVMICIRLNIAQLVSLMSTYMVNPKKKHW